MNFIKKYFFITLLAVSVFIPQFATAQTNPNQTCDDLRKQFQNAGGGDVINSLPQYCSTGQIYTKFLNFALYAVGIAAVIYAIYGGYLYMTAGGNAAQAKKGRDVLVWAIIGLVVVVTAAVIVNVVIKAIVENQFV